MSGINIETIEGKVTKGGPAGVLLPAGMKEVFQKKFFFIYALIIQVRCDRSLTER